MKSTLQEKKNSTSMDSNDQPILSGCSLLTAEKYSTNRGLQDARKSYDLIVSTQTSMNQRTEILPIKKVFFSSFLIHFNSFIFVPELMRKNQTKVIDAINAT